MKGLGPFHTLGAGAVIAVALGVASAHAAPTVQQAEPVAAAPAAEATGQAVPGASAAPEPTADAAGAKAAEAAGPTPGKADYAGVVQGNGGLVAISIRDGKAIAYFCDGRNEVWLKGTAEHGTVVLEGRRSLITAALGGGKAQGRLEFRGARWRFVAPVAKKPSGLYRAGAVVRGARIDGGWIVLADGRQVGMVNFAGSSEPAPAIDPGAPVTIYGTRLVPQEVDSFIDTWTPEVAS